MLNLGVTFLNSLAEATDKIVFTSVSVEVAMANFAVGELRCHEWGRKKWRSVTWCIRRTLENCAWVARSCRPLPPHPLYTGA